LYPDFFGFFEKLVVGEGEG